MTNVKTPTIQDKIENWKERLANATNSNPLLNLQKNKRRMLEIFTPASSLFEYLTGDDTQPIPVNELITQQTEVERTKAFKKLYQTAKATLEEKGVNSLFIALGTLTLPKSKKAKESFVAPILLIPVQLQKTRKEYTLHSSEEDISLNSLLVKKLDDEFGITLPESEKLLDLPYSQFMEKVREAIPESQGLQVAETAYISLFDDTKAAMIQDLKDHENIIAAHPILQGIAKNREPYLAEQPKVISEKELDKIPPGSVFQILDADSSQQVVIEAAKVGLSFVVQGPPGTGKSQTIANIVAELIGMGKSVLLVSEKKTALDVVYDRLKKCRLEDVCLNLHHQETTNKKNLLKELNQAVNQLQQHQESQKYDSFFNELRDCRQTLNSQPADLHQEQPPLNKSAFNLYGEILKLQRDGIPTLGFNLLNVRDWSDPLLLKAKNFLDKLGGFEQLFRGEQTTVWSKSQVQLWSPEVSTNLRENIAELRHGIQQAKKAVSRLGELLSIEIPNTLSASALDRLQPAVAYVAAIPSGIESWSLSTGITELQQLFSKLKVDVKGIQTNPIRGKYNQEFLDSEDLLYRELNTLIPELETSRHQIKAGFNFLREHFPPDLIALPGVSLDNTSLDEVEKFLDVAQAELDSFRNWLDCQQLVQKLEEIGAKDFLLKLRESNLPPESWYSVLKKGVYENWLDYIYSDNFRLRSFNQKEHERKVKEFSQLDTQQYTVAIERLQQLHAERWREWSEKPEAKHQIELLKTESNKKPGKHKKIRRFIEGAPQLVTTLKPCWLMSPLAVSQYINPLAVRFDVVIFDEASQIRTEDAVPSIMRATQVIVVGDNRQLPPTSSIFTGTVSDEEEDEGVYESLLDECNFMKDFTLKWHYRSQDESLIAFSNYYFYGSKLISFPNPVKDDSRGVHFEFVEGGIYDRGGQTDNILEAKKVAALTQEHIHDPRNQNQSLGIITFSQAQANAIREQLEQLKDPELEAFCQDDSDKFFLKPLEHAQGNEADVIFLSFGYGYDDPNNREKLNHNFGPLSRSDMGRRRLNVAITRAKRKLVLVASIEAKDFEPKGKIQEVEIIRDYFAYADDNGKELKENPHNISPSNWLLEEDIYQALIERNYKVDRAVGRSDYPINLAVKDDRQKDGYLLGIECDGTTYRRYPTARDRDRLRRAVLEDNLQWDIYRIWSSEWFRDREGQLNQLVKRIEHLRVQKSTQAVL